MRKGEGISISICAHAGHQLGARDAHDHLAVEQKRKPAEHPALSDACSRVKRLTDALGQTFIERHVVTPSCYGEEST
jgi:hypothetical protein